MYFWKERKKIESPPNEISLTAYDTIGCLNRTYNNSMKRTYHSTAFGHTF